MMAWVRALRKAFLYDKNSLHKRLWGALGAGKALGRSGRGQGPEQAKNYFKDRSFFKMLKMFNFFNFLKVPTTYYLKNSF